MANLNPTLNTGISYEQPTQVPQGGGSTAATVLDLASSLFPSGKVEKTKPSAKELESAALQPFTQRLEDLRNSDLSDAEFTRQARILQRKQLTQTPEYSTEIGNITSDYGVTEPVLEVSPREAMVEARNEWITTPEGQEASFRSAVYTDEGFLDEEATAGNLNQAYAESQAEQALVAKTARRTELAQNDVALWKAESEKGMAEFLPTWTKRTQLSVNNMLALRNARSEQFDSPEEQLAFLREARRTHLDNYRSSAQAAGIHQEVYKSQIDEALAPIDNLIKTMEDNAGDMTTINNALDAATQRNATEFLVDNLGPLGINPEFQRQVFTNLGSTFYSEENFMNAVTMGVNNANAGRTSGLDLLPGLPVSEEAANQGASTESIGNPEYIDELRTSEKKNPGTLSKNIQTASQGIQGLDPNTPDGQAAILMNIGEIVNAAQAGSSSGDPLGQDLLNQVLSPQNVRKFATLGNGATQDAQDAKAAVQLFTAREGKKNLDIVNSLISTSLPQGYQLRDNGSGRLAIFDNEGRNIQDVLNSDASVLEFPPAIAEDALQAVRNLNTIIAAEKRVFGEQSVSLPQERPQAQGAVNKNTGSQASTENLQINTGVGPLIELVDREEGGGDYNTLFSFSNREGGRFAGTNVSQMTIGELKEFSDGEYAQWSREQLGYKATPMGRYQFVGTTLEATADAMGLPDDTVFSPEVQDAMFSYKVQQRLRGKSSQAAKRNALRSEWKGFDNASDTELDRAIAAFEGADFSDIGTSMTRPSGPVDRPINYSDLRTSDETQPAQRQVQPASQGGDIVQFGERDYSAVSTPTVGEGTQEAPTATSGQDTGSQERSGSQVRQDEEVERLAAESEALFDISDGNGGRRLSRLLSREGKTRQDIRNFTTEEEFKAAIKNNEVQQDDIVVVNGQVRIL